MRFVVIGDNIGEGPNYTDNIYLKAIDNMTKTLAMHKNIIYACDLNPHELMAKPNTIIDITIEEMSCCRLYKDHKNQLKLVNSITYCPFCGAKVGQEQKNNVQ